MMPDVSCRACDAIPTTRPFYNEPLCAGCEAALREGTIPGTEIPRSRVAKFIQKQSELRERLK